MLYSIPKPHRLWLTPVSQDSDDPSRNPRNKGFAAAASGSGGLFAGGSGPNGLLAGDLGSGGPSNLGKVGNASASPLDLGAIRDSFTLQP